MTEAIGTALGRIVASADPAPARGQGLLTALRAAVPFDAAWLAYADSHGAAHDPLAAIGLHDDVLEVLARSAVSDSTWEDCLRPAGFRGSLSLTLVARGGRRVGRLLLLSRSSAPASAVVRRRLARLRPVLAAGIDPMPSLLATTRLVAGVTAGTVLQDDGSTAALLGLDTDPLLSAGSSVLAVARQRLHDGQCHASFLWPLGDPVAADGHVRVTAVAAPGDGPAFLTGTVLLSPAGDLRGLTPRELEVLGLVVLGHSNQQIASRLAVAPRTVAAHLEHVLAKLGTSTRTTAAVRAEREGLHVPPLTTLRAATVSRIVAPIGRSADGGPTTACGAIQA